MNPTDPRHFLNKPPLTIETKAACPAFTRWMKRQIFKTGQHKKRTAIADSHAVLPRTETLAAAAFDYFQRQLQLNNPFLRRLLSMLQEDPVVSTAWNMPMLESKGIDAVEQLIFKHSRGRSTTQWTRSIDLIWPMALQAARDRSLAKHEREIAFIVALVRPLLDRSIVRYAHSHEDLGLLEKIRCARQACTSESETGEDVGSTSANEIGMHLNGEDVMAQALLLKSLLTPGMVDVDADQIDRTQRDRIALAVERVLNAHKAKQLKSQSSQSEGRTCTKTHLHNEQSHDQRQRR